MRGTAPRSRICASSTRITPACAGNRHTIGRSGQAIEDHPRVCGEQRFHDEPPNNLKGSPPRVRGTAHVGMYAPSSSRITPACAGNSYGEPAGLFGIKDHPRVCGEQDGYQEMTTEQKGSPPRVRGTVEFLFAHSCQQRITPACAGNRATDPPRGGECGDHPRVCGEQYAGFSAFSITVGSPPRVRGTGKRWWNYKRIWRITPACAGNSI